MKAIILNSAPGVGKTTLLKQLEGVLPKNFAIIDGDDVGRIIPLKLSIAWLNLIQDNIVSCAKNYKGYGIDFLIIAFVFPSEERVDRLTKLLKDINIDVLYRCSLICDAAELKQRIKKRNTTRFMNFERAIECNIKIKQLKSELVIDTTQRGVEEIRDLFVDSILTIVKGNVDG